MTSPPLPPEFEKEVERIAEERSMDCGSPVHPHLSGSYRAQARITAIDVAKAAVALWRDVTGKTIRVSASWGKVNAIGHIINDDWFDPSKDFKELDDKGAIK